MPKEGKSDAEWKERLNQYAAGHFRFGKGQKPAPQSKWSKILEKIEKCPKKTSSSSKIYSENLCYATADIIPL
jgi:hypothetical protein